MQSRVLEAIPSETSLPDILSPKQLDQGGSPKNQSKYDYLKGKSSVYFNKVKKDLIKMQRSNYNSELYRSKLSQMGSASRRVESKVEIEQYLPAKIDITKLNIQNFQNKIKKF